MTAEPTEEVQIQAARARWRADLLAYDAAERARIVGDNDSGVAQELLAEGTKKEAEATVHLDHAEAIEKHSIAKQRRDANPKDAEANRAYQKAAQDLTDLRVYWRSIGEALSARSSVQNVDNFEEPSDEEVLASHGGTK